MTVSLNLRHDVTRDIDGTDTVVRAQPDEVNLLALTPRARALAECIADSPTRSPGAVILEHRLPLRDTVPAGQRTWYSEEETARPERRTWSGWSPFPADSAMTAVEWLEEQARKIPPDWHPLGAFADRPVPSRDAGAADRYMTRIQAIGYLAARGRSIDAGTWDSYRSRGQAPQPDKYVGRTPLWHPDTLDAWLAGRWQPGDEPGSHVNPSSDADLARLVLGYREFSPDQEHATAELYRRRPRLAGIWAAYLATAVPVPEDHDPLGDLDWETEQELAMRRRIRDLLVTEITAIAEGDAGTGEA